MDLKNEYPNYVSAINYMKDTTDLTQCKSNSKVLSYGMTYKVFGNKLADIYIDLNKHEDFVYVSFASFKGLIEKARTIGDKVFNDLEVENWIEIISDVMNKHNANPQHAKLVMDFTRKRINKTQNTGCLIALFLIIIPLVSFALSYY